MFVFPIDGSNPLFIKNEPETISSPYFQYTGSHFRQFPASNRILFCLTVSDIISDIYIHIDEGFLYLSVLVIKNRYYDIFFVGIIRTLCLA